MLYYSQNPDCKRFTLGFKAVNRYKQQNPKYNNLYNTLKKEINSTAIMTVRKHSQEVDPTEGAMLFQVLKSLTVSRQMEIRMDTVPEDRCN